MIHIEHGTLQYRQVNALSWRVVSELSRRDSRLYIALTGDAGSAAHYDSLILTGPTGAEYQARRTGLGFTAGQGGAFQIEWHNALKMASARTIAIALERSRNVRLPYKSPASTPRSLGYRVMALALEMTLGDQRQWLTRERVGGPLDKSVVSNPARLLPYEDTRWTLYRDDAAIAVLDNFGWLQVGDRRIDLHSRYRELNGRIYPLIMDVFDSILP